MSALKAGGTLVAAAGALLAVVLAQGGETPTGPPRVFHANTYPAHEEHTDEKVAIAIDPYDLPEKTSFFKVRYREEGFLPIRLIITNDADQPIALKDMKLELITVDRAKIPPASSDDIYRRLAAPVTRPDKPRPVPLPLPKRKVKRRVSRETEDEVESLQFRALAVEPHNTQAGFLFFDVSGIDNPMAGAHLYLTGLRSGEGKGLFYFDIPLEKYLSYRPPH